MLIFANSSFLCFWSASFSKTSAEEPLSQISSYQTIPAFSVRTLENQLRDRDGHKEIKACRYWPASHTDTEEERNSRSIPVVANPGTDTTAPLCFDGWAKASSEITRTKGPVAILRLSKGSSTPSTAAPLDTRLTGVMFGLQVTNERARILSCNQPELHSHGQDVRI